VDETCLNSHGTLRGRGCFIDKKSSYVLRKYVYETPEFVTEVLHGSTIHFKKIIANCCNISHAHFLPRRFIFMHKKYINVFKMLSVKCEEIWQFDIRMFSNNMNQETLKCIYVAYSNILRISLYYFYDRKDGNI